MSRSRLEGTTLESSTVSGRDAMSMSPTMRQVLAGLSGDNFARLSDAELLARFAANRDEADFAVLVERHGPAVLGVCRRMLRHQQDTEDAAQAVFLVLARNA